MALRRNEEDCRHCVQLALLSLNESLGMVEMVRENLCLHEIGIISREEEVD